MPVRLPVPGGDVSGVLTLRTVDNSEQAARDSGVRIAGRHRRAGWIGLEVAAAARAAGVAVTVIEAAELPLLGVLGPEVAQVFLDLHREHDVDFRPRAQVAEILVSADAATGVRLADGTEISADAVVTGIGVAPATGLAEATGLDVDGGVRTDASLRTSNPVIYAAGDTACAYHPLLGTYLRVEHWSNARHQPVAAARAMLGQDVAYDRLPYSLQRPVRPRHGVLRVRAPGGYDQVVFRGDVGQRSSSRSGCLAGGCSRHERQHLEWDDQIQELIRGGRPVRTPAGWPTRACPWPRRPESQAQRPRRCAVRSRCARMMADAASGSRWRTASMNCSCSRVPRLLISGRPRCVAPRDYRRRARATADFG